MMIYLSPQVVLDDEKINYSFSGEKITVEYNKKTDVFDFSGLPDGALELVDSEGNQLIETSLDIIPILSGKKVDGILSFELLNFIDSDASEAEKFPEWIDAKDYQQPEEAEAEKSGGDKVEK